MSGSDLIFSILFWIPACKHETWSSHLFGLFWDARGASANCLLSHPRPLPDPLIHQAKPCEAPNVVAGLTRKSPLFIHHFQSSIIPILFIEKFICICSLPGTLFIPWASADDCRTFILSRYFFELFNHTHSVSQASALLHSRKDSIPDITNATAITSTGFAVQDQ